MASCRGPLDERSAVLPLHTSSTASVIEADAPSDVRATSREAVSSVGVSGEITPEVLIPRARPEASPTSEVGGMVMDKRVAFDRFREIHPRTVDYLLDLIEGDVMVAEQARKAAITIRSEEVADLTGRLENQIRERVKREFRGTRSYEAYLQGLGWSDVKEHQRWLSLFATRMLFREFTRRYMALRQDRVRVRFIVQSDRRVLEDIAQRVRDGADFATLATRYSEDAATRRNGGSLPEFTKDFDHPVTEVAFALTPGQISDVIAKDVAGESRYFVIYCLGRVPAQDVDFVSVRGEIYKAIQERVPALSSAAAGPDQVRDDR